MRFLLIIFALVDSIDKVASSRTIIMGDLPEFVFGCEACRSEP